MALSLGRRARRPAARDPERHSPCLLSQRSQTQPQGFLPGTLLQGLFPEQDWDKTLTCLRVPWPSPQQLSASETVTVIPHIKY